jgi:PAS domain-containing protein
VHDVHRILFFIPIIYAGYVFRVRGALIVTVAAFLVFLPRALSTSPYPHPLLRMSLFVVSGGVMGVLTGMVRNETERRGQLEALVKNERDRLLGMLEIIGEGVLLIDPEYRIRFMNRSMARKLGEGIGSLCSSICTTLINHVAKSAGLQR